MRDLLGISRLDQELLAIVQVLITCWSAFLASDCYWQSDGRL